VAETLFLFFMFERTVNARRRPRQGVMRGGIQ
jgi:hypothetical protein